MRAAVLPLLLLALPLACAARPRQTEGDTPQVFDGDHPDQLIALSGAHGQFTYDTRGTAADRDVRRDAELGRLIVDTAKVGVNLEWMETSSSFLGSQAEGFEAFLYGIVHYRPVYFTRFALKPGIAYDKLNVTRSGPNDVEPWSIGPRADLEGEIDLYKTDVVAISYFLNGGFGIGWGEARVGDDREGIVKYGWRAESGVRFNLYRFHVALSYLRRGSDIDQVNLVEDASYGFEGGSLTIGARW